MSKSISIPFKTDEMKNHIEIPVVYEIEVENDRVCMIHCKINLSELDKPEWL